MFIKYIMIKRYKSYRELSYMEPLSKSVNVVIGANGNGKSNFLDAIIFVLTDKYQSLRQEEKKLLLHEDMEDKSAEAEVISVELVLDNKSRRFPVDKDTVSIAKVYSVRDNREDIIINQKKLLKADAANLLESAGFSKSNPYYIIQQGKINAMINMSEYDYYEIFSEVTGTKTYEEKKAESLKLLEDSKANRDKIKKQKNEISEYITRLETQCVDLNDFEELEGKRKVYEAFILNEKITQFQINCEFLEERKKDQMGDLNILINAQGKYKQKISEKNAIINKKNKIAMTLRSKIERCTAEINNINSVKFANEENLKMIADAKMNNNHDMNALIGEMDNLKLEKEKSQKKLLEIEKKIAALNKEINLCQNEYNETKSKNDFLLLKSPQQRKEYLSNEISKLNTAKGYLNNNIIQLQNEINSNETLLRNSLATESNNAAQRKDLNASSSVIINDLVKSKNDRRDIVNKIKKNEIEINEANEEISSLAEQIKTAEISFPNFDVFQTVTSLKQMNIRGVYGLLFDAFLIDQKAKNAADLILGNRLYSLIVDTFSTAHKVLEINKEKNGPVITIIPLDFIEDEPLPQKLQVADAVSILNFININPDFTERYSGIPAEKINALKNKYFSKCMLVKNYEVGMKLSKQFDITCVTGDNEIIYKGGYMTKIGYYNYERQRFNLYSKYNELSTMLNDLNLRKEDLVNDKKVLLDDENEIVRKQQSLLKDKSEIDAKLETIAKNENSILVAIANANEMKLTQKNMMDSLLSQKSEIEEKIKLYTDLSSNKIEVKSQMTSQILSDITALEKKIIEMKRTQNELIKEKMSIESKLANEITKKEIEIKAQANLLSLSEMKTENQTEASSVDLTNNELELFTKALSKYKRDLTSIEGDIEKESKEIEILNFENDKLVTRIAQCEGELKGIALSLNEKTEKKNSLLKQIASLGSVDVKETEKLKAITEKEIKALANESGINIRDKEMRQEKILEPIYHKLEGIAKKMKKFEKINRFAIDDYKLFKSKRDEIDEKLNDLDEKQNEILEVIKVLDKKKDNAIQTTFNKVNESFEFFFKELVPNGAGNLVLNANDKTIHISVSFNGDQSQSMHQLSGGQKTAVAVALIFALSKIDPPPFYILDEIDAALDPALRINLSKLILNLSETNQFIISTFKPELLDTAENIYQVKFANKTSNVIKVEKEEAKKFLRDTF